MVTLGNECGVNTRALMTNMDIPLGRAAGNWLEVKEAVACLEGSSEIADLRAGKSLAFETCPEHSPWAVYIPDPSVESPIAEN